MDVIEETLEKLKSEAMIENIKNNLKFWITWVVICILLFIAFGFWVSQGHHKIEQSVAQRAEERKAETTKNLKILEDIQAFQYKMDTSQQLLLENREIWSKYVDNIQKKLDVIDRKIEEKVNK
jgi:hypothetical protein